MLELLFSLMFSKKSNLDSKITNDFLATLVMILLGDMNKVCKIFI